MDMKELKAEAEDLGLSFPGNISRKKLEALMEGATMPEPETGPYSETAEDKTEEVPEKPKRVLTPKAQAKKDGGKLMRVRITCHDPQFKKHNGLIRAAGSVLYFKKRFVPFNRPTHIEKVIYDFMKQTEYQWFEEKVNRATGRKYKVPRSSPAFVIEDLPPLTPQELKELALDQANRGAIEDD